MQWIKSKNSDSWSLVDGNKTKAHVSINAPFYPDEINGHIYTQDGGTVSWGKISSSMAEAKRFLEWVLTQNRTYNEWVLQDEHDVVFMLGQGLRKNFYTLFSGTPKECAAFIEDLPSENDAGWENADAGTNPYREACTIQHQGTR